MGRAPEDCTEEDKLDLKPKAVGRKSIYVKKIELGSDQEGAVQLSEKYRQIPYAGTHSLHSHIKTILIDTDVAVNDGDLCLCEVPGQGRILKRVRQAERLIILEDPGMAGTVAPIIIRNGTVKAAKVVGFLID